MTDDGTLTSAQVLECLPGITYRQLDYWARCGYVTSIEQPFDGSGHPRRWHRQTVDQLAQRVEALRLVKNRAELHRRIIAGEIVVTEVAQ